MRTVLEIAIRAGKSFSEDRCPLFAASITYFSLISLFPLAMFAIGVAGFVLGSEGDQQRIVDELTRALPLSEGKGREDLQSLISSAVDARGALGVVGLLGTAYAGSALFGAVRASLVTVYEKEKRRPLIKAKLLDIAFVLGFTALLMLSVALTFVIALAQRYSVELFGEPAATPISWLLTLAYPTVPAAVSFLVFFLLFTVVASAGLRKADAAWGAVVATAGFEALKVGFAQYVAYFGNYDATYGTIG
ncbi:MAG: YihY/virulence factor BrkB family protein, partial [Dehalococcoidia bacterium]